MKNQSPKRIPGWNLILCLLCIFFIPDPCRADDELTSGPYDEVTAMGGTFFCRIQRLGNDGLEVEPAYARGTVKVPSGDLQNVVSLERFHVVFGGGLTVRGRLLGIESGELLVGDDPDSAMRIRLWAVEAGVPEDDYDKSLLTRLRTDYHNWSVDLDVGWKLEEGALNKHELEVGLNLERRGKPNRFLFDIRYAFETEQAGDSQRVTTKDEFASYLLMEYDISESFYVFMQPAGEWDTRRGIDLRIYPAAGVGYRFVEEEGKQTRLFFPAGLGYVYEDFVDVATNDYEAVYLGAHGRYDFGGGIVLTGDVLYMLGILEPSKDWLFRFDVNLTVPVVEPFALKIRLTQVNDNNPSPDIGNNKLTTGFAMSLRF